MYCVDVKGDRMETEAMQTGTAFGGQRPGKPLIPFKIYSNNNSMQIH